MRWVFILLQLLISSGCNVIGSFNELPVTNNLTLSFDQNTIVIPEGNSALIGVFLSEKRPTPTIVRISISSPRNDVAADFSSFPTTITIPANSLTGSFSLSTVVDGLYENNEDFVLTLVADETDIISNGVLNITVLDGDLPKASISSLTTSLNEFDSSTTGSFTITLDKSPITPVSLALSSTGTATIDTDFAVSPSTTVNFAAGETSKNVTVSVVQDRKGEGIEQITLQLGNYSGLLAGTTTNASIPINDTFDFNFSSLHNDGTDFSTRPHPYNLISFSRSTTGTYVDADGIIKTAAANIPRFNHDPTTGQPLGLLVEANIQNVVTQNEEFDLNWIQTGIKAFGSGSVINSTAVRAPDNNQTSELIVEDTSGADHSLTRTFSVSANQRWNFSVFVEANGRSAVQLKIAGAAANFGAMICPLSNDPVTTTVGGNGAIDTFNRVAYKNGWYKCYLRARPTNVASATTTLTVSLVNSGLDNYTGDDASGVYIWGAVATPGSTTNYGLADSSYVPNPGTTTISRLQDNPVITDISGMYRSTTGGTIYTEFNLEGIVENVAGGANPRVFSFDDGSGGNRIEYVSRSYLGATSMNISGSTGSMATNLVTGPNITYRTGFTIEPSGWHAVVNEVNAYTNAVATMPLSTTLRFGRSASTGFALRGNLGRFLYTPYVVSPTVLANWGRPLEEIYSSIPDVSVSTESVVTTESSGPVSFVIGLSDKSATAVTVDYSIAGSATYGSDYTSSSAVSGTATFNPGETKKVITLQPTVDGDSGAETAILTISNPVNANLGGTTAQTITIND